MCAEEFKQACTCRGQWEISAVNRVAIPKFPTFKLEERVLWRMEMNARLITYLTTAKTMEVDVNSVAETEQDDPDENAAFSNRVYFPDDLWLFVLEKLPWAGIARARAVCKGWKGLIESQHFLEAVSSQPPWLFVSTALDDTVKDDLHAYDPVTDKWERVSMAFLDKQQQQQQQQDRFTRWIVVSSTGGLVYVVQEPCRDLLIEVFSPITKKKRTVACSGFTRSRETVTPVVWTFLGDDAAHTGCHHLLVASSSEGWGTRLYCPSDADWEEVGDGHPKLRDSRDSKYACSVRDEKFFVLVEDEVDAGLDGEGNDQVEYRIVLLCFDAVDGAWEEYNMFPFERAEDAVIVEFQDCLHMVAASCEGDRLSIRIYRFLERHRDAWVEVTSTRELYPLSFSANLGFFQLACATSGDMLYVVGYAEDTALAAVCDFSDGFPRWRKISNVPFNTVGFCFCCTKKVGSSHDW